jgi:tetratricopeptide (TPR) repeat protein
MLYTFRYTFVADHYQYLASIGPIALVSAGLITLSRSSKSLHWPVVVGALAILAFLSLLTWRQSATYHDAETLWRTTIAKNPDCWMAYNNLGVVQFEKGSIEDAIEKYQRSLRLHANYPEAHYNLGSALLQKGDADEAIRQCEEALEIQPNEPDAHIVLGNAFMAKQDVDRAIGHYVQALHLRPDDSNAHYNLGTALKQKGEVERAAQEYETAATLERRHQRD